jgi:hypothetical protein
MLDVGNVEMRKADSFNLKESWRLTNIQSQIDSTNVLHGNLRKSNWMRTSEKLSRARIL